MEQVAEWIDKLYKREFEEIKFKWNKDDQITVSITQNGVEDD